MQYIVAAYTDTGIEKETNQDSICVRRAEIQEYGELVMAVVCDGMGGLEKGEVASAACVCAFGDWFDKNMGTLPIACQKSFDGIMEQWSELVNNVHNDLHGYASRHNIQLGTTISGLITCGDRYLTINVGDSRVYERKTILQQLTQDQSLVAQEIEAGRITADEARHHPQRNILLQCLGTGESVSPQFTEGRIQNEALYLLCTDGLVHELSCIELEAILQPTYLKSKKSMTDALIRATDVCKSRGERDNITSILIRSNESRSEPKPTAGIKKFFQRNNRESAIQPFSQVSLLEKALITHTQESISN